MFDRQNTLAKVDPQLWEAIQNENKRQEDHIELIASENYTSPAVIQAQGSQLTNKYAEGYPGKRYYGGCEFVDVAEQLAIDRVKALFGAEAANVQPHCGASANQAVFLAFLKPGDTFMGMSLAEGGHLTHGMALNMSGKWFNPIAYGLDKNEEIDYEQMERLAIDRADHAVAHLYDPLHPAILHLLANIIEQAKRANVPIAVCGEMAGDPSLTRLLLALGLTDFSMHFSQLLLVKREILKANVGLLKARVPRVLKAYEPEDQTKALERLLA